VPSAGREIVIAVQDGRPFAGEQPAIAQGGKRAAQERVAPAVEQVARDGEMIGTARGDAIELTLQPDHIAGVSQVQVRQMRDQQSVRSSCPGSNRPSA
jgi:hypothetical protein